MLSVKCGTHPLHDLLSYFVSFQDFSPVSHRARHKNGLRSCTKMELAMTSLVLFVVDETRAKNLSLYHSYV